LRRLRKFLALTPAGRSLVLRSLVLLPAVAALLGTGGMGRTIAWLDRLGRRRGSGDLGALPPEEIARLIKAAASLLRVQCLARSLVLWHSLRAGGTWSEVRFGVSKLADGSLCAHAWVELDGLALIDGPGILGGYAALPSFAVTRHSGHPGALEC